MVEMAVCMNFPRLILDEFVKRTDVHEVVHVFVGLERDAVVLLEQVEHGDGAALGRYVYGQVELVGVESGDGAVLEQQADEVHVVLLDGQVERPRVGHVLAVDELAHEAARLVEHAHELELVQYELVLVEELVVDEPQRRRRGHILVRVTQLIVRRMRVAGHRVGNAVLAVAERTIRGGHDCTGSATANVARDRQRRLRHADGVAALGVRLDAAEHHGYELGGELLAHGRVEMGAHELVELELDGAHEQELDHLAVLHIRATRVMQRQVVEVRARQVLEMHLLAGQHHLDNAIAAVGEGGVQRRLLEMIDLVEPQRPLLEQSLHAVVVVALGGVVQRRQAARVLGVHIYAL